MSANFFYLLPINFFNILVIFFSSFGCRQIPAAPKEIITAKQPAAAANTSGPFGSAFNNGFDEVSLGMSDGAANDGSPGMFGNADGDISLG